MNRNVKQPVAVACLFTWIGFVSAISFMEAWLKFQAPGVTLPIGLGIGRLVFGALNKVEWVLALVVCISTTLYSRPFMIFPSFVLLGIVVILAVQSIWLLPLLDHRAEQYIQGQPVTPSRSHLWFVGAEIVKVTGLFIAAVSHFKQPQINGATTNY